MKAKALDAALTLLAARRRTEAELRRALGRKGYPPGEREAAVARVRELGYLDDRDAARARARSLLDRGASPRFALRRLLEQGIAAEEARAAVATEAGEGGEEALLRRALARRLAGREAKEEAEKRRIFRALVRKGFRAQAVARALGISWDGDDDEVE